MQDQIDELSFLANFLNEGIYVVNDNIETDLKEEKDPEISTVKEPEPVIDHEIEFFGENKKQVCIIVDYDNDEWIIPKDKLVLQKILTAVDLSFDDIALVNVNRLPDYDLEKIINLIPNAKVISYGISESLTLDIEKNKVITDDNRQLLCCSDSLTSIAMSKQKKTVLWNNLKEMFGK